MRLVNFNGQLIPESHAKISIYDSALMFGDMVFEMTRSFNGKQFKLREHLERLYAGIKILRIPVGIDIDEMERRCLETQEANQFAPDDEHRLMIDVSRGTLVATNILRPDSPDFGPGRCQHGNDPYWREDRHLLTKADVGSFGMIENALS